MNDIDAYDYRGMIDVEDEYCILHYYYLYCSARGGIKFTTVESDENDAGGYLFGEAPDWQIIVELGRYLKSELSNPQKEQWKQVKSYARKIMDAVNAEDRKELVDNLFFLVAELASVNGVPTLESCKYGWNDAFGLVTDSFEEAEVIAVLFDSMYEGCVCVTGKWDAKEDIRNKECDEWTGRAYVRNWQ